MCVLTVARSGYDGNSTKLSKILLNGNNICMVRLDCLSLTLGPDTDMSPAYPRRRGTGSSTVIVSPEGDAQRGA